MILLFLKGAILGLAIAAPVGPINLLCMRRSLTYGQRVGFLTGLGAAFADTVYGAIAAFSLTWISDLFVAYQGYLALIGGLFFIIIGIKIIRSPPATETIDAQGPSVKRAVASTFVLTLSNPATIFSFLAAFAAVDLGTGVPGNSDHLRALVATVGVFFGSCTWWLFLSWISAHLRSILTPKSLHRINVITGSCLVVFALMVLIRGFTYL